MLRRPDRIRPRTRRTGTVRTTGSSILAAVLVAALAVVASGCGSTSSASSNAPAAAGTTTTPATTGNGSAADRTAFTDCLKEHGVTDLPQFGRGGFGRGAFGGGSADGAAPNGGTTTNAAAPNGTAPNGGAPGGGAAVLTPEQQAAFEACRSLLRARTGGPGGGGFADDPAFAEYRQCLQDHGVDPGTTDRSSSEFQAAAAACASLRPAGGFGGNGGNGGGGGTGASPAFAKYQQCLAEHGVKPGGNPSSDTIQKAIAACRSLLPNNGNGSTGTTSG